MSTFMITNIVFENEEEYDAAALATLRKEFVDVSYNAESFDGSEDDEFGLINNFMDYHQSQGIPIRDMDIQFVWND